MRNGRLLRTVLFGLLFATNSSGASADAIITDFGVFASCKEALAFRDGALVPLLDKSFQHYDFDRETMLDTIVKKDQAQIFSKLKDIDAKTKDQRATLKVAAAQLALTYLAQYAAKRTINTLPDTAVRQKKTLQAVVDGTNGVVLTLGTAVATGKVDAVAAAIDRVKTMADVITAAMTSGKFGRQIELLSSIYTVGAAGIPAAADWLDAQADKQADLTQIDLASTAIAAVLKKSDAATIASINAGKNKIDANCKQAENPPPKQVRPIISKPDPGAGSGVRSGVRGGGGSGGSGGSGVGRAGAGNSKFTCQPMQHGERCTLLEE
jgi:hypothetical protein